MKRTIIAAGALALAATPVMGKPLTGETLHRVCEESDEFCIGYAAGVHAGMTIAGLGGCSLEPSIMVGQLLDVITKYLRGHPEHRHYQADALVAAAIVTAWPNACEGE